MGYNMSTCVCGLFVTLNVYTCCIARKEWLEMRGIFYNLQKQKVKDMKQQLKEEESTHRERGDKGYVGKCLVKVERVGVGEGEDLVTLEKLKVWNSVQIEHSFSNH